MRQGTSACLRAALAALAALALLVGTAGPSTADTIGGDRLASTHRTVDLLPGADPLPEIWAETWIIADATTGHVLAQKGSHVRRAPASTLKMLTALTVLPVTSPQTTVVATKKAAYTYGARVGLRPGRSYSLDDLWYAVFLPSANDAAIAVAQANGGVRKTLREMNAVAARLQANDTVARTPNGLDRRGQLSSAYDLTLIARAGLARADFAKYAGTARATFPDTKGKGRHPIYTTNRLLLKGYRGIIGVKTGFTSQAGRTYVGAARRGGTTLIVALMGIHESSESAARKLLDWGFANRDAVSPVGVLVDPLPDAPASVPEPTSAALAPTTAPAPRTAAPAPSIAPDPAGPSQAVLWGAGAAAAAAGGLWIAAAVRRRRG